MSKLALFDEEIYSTLEVIIDSIALHLPVGTEGTSSFPDKEILGKLQQQGYNPKMSWAFLRACYRHLADKKIMIVDYSLRYRLTGRINDERKTDLCMNIFSEYENYLQANYARSLIDPDPCAKPEKTPDSSPGSTLKSSFSGGK